MRSFIFLLLIAISCGKSELDGTGILDPGQPPGEGAAAVGTLEGKITDGQNGNDLPGVSVNVLGLNDSTDVSGNYSISNVGTGTRTVSISKAGYISQSPQVVIVDGQTTQLNVSLLTAGYAAGKIVIVLTWGASPADLDSHLLVPVTASSTFHLFYSDVGDTDGTLDEAPYAGLDTDDTDGNGPETISVSWNGTSLYYPRTYRYYVHNYSNETPLKDSGAEVRVYRNGALLQAFTVPATCGDNVNDRNWHVFDIAANSTVTPVNNCTASPPPNIY